MMFPRRPTDSFRSDNNPLKIFTKIRSLHQVIATSIRITHEEAKIYDLNNFNPSYNYKLGHLTKSATNINTEKPKKKKKNPRVSEAECPDLWTPMSFVPWLFWTLIITWRKTIFH